MMLGEHHRPNPAVHVPPWATLEDDPTVSSFSTAVADYSPLYLQEALKALQSHLPSAGDEFSSAGDDHPDSPVDAYTCDHFRMYDFKVRRCARGRSHDWTECPFAHPGEKARRRDPRKYHYSGTACPDFRKGLCKKGDACEYAHGVFECWLHPARYRTQPCKDGADCRRRVCFFAHSTDQLRVLPGNQSLSPLSLDLPGNQSLSPVSPPATPPSMDSPPMSPMMSRSLGSGSFNEVVASLRNLQLSKVKSIPSSWGVQVGGGGGGSGFGSPRGSVVRPGFFSLPTTPTQVPVRVGFWDRVCMDEEGEEEEVVMERVESGRDIRKKMFEKLSKDNHLELADPDLVGGGAGPGPDVGWVSDLLM